MEENTIDTLFPRTLGFGYRVDASFRRDGDAHCIEYANEGDLVYRIRLGTRCELDEFCGGNTLGSTQHQNLAKAFLHHGLVFYTRQFGQKFPPVWERRLLECLPAGLTTPIYGPPGDDVYFPDGVFRRILLPSPADPKPLLTILESLGVRPHACFPIPDAFLQIEEEPARSIPFPLVHVAVFAREAAPLLKKLWEAGCVSTHPSGRAILFYARPTVWPKSFWFQGPEQTARYRISFPGGQFENFLEHLRDPAALSPEEAEEERISRGRLRARYERSQRYLKSLPPESQAPKVEPKSQPGPGGL